jgi:hypothetical protein
VAVRAVTVDADPVRDPRPQDIDGGTMSEMTDKFASIARPLIAHGFSPALARLVIEREESDAKLKAVGGPDYEDLDHEVEVRWNRAYAIAIQSEYPPMPSRAQIVDSVIRDYCLGQLPFQWTELHRPDRGDVLPAALKVFAWSIQDALRPLVDQFAKQLDRKTSTKVGPR